jgi:hypothetical protein
MSQKRVLALARAVARIDVNVTCASHALRGASAPGVRSRQPFRGLDGTVEKRGLEVVRAATFKPAPIHIEEDGCSDGSPLVARWHPVDRQLQ